MKRIIKIGMGVHKDSTTIAIIYGRKSKIEDIKIHQS